MSYDSLSLTEALQIAADFHAQGDFQSSLSLCIQILTPYPSCAPAWNLAGLNVLRLQLPHKAIDYFHTAYTHESDPAYLINLAEAYRRADEPQESLTILRALQRSNPKNPTLLYNLARTLKDSGALEESITTYRALLALEPHDSEALYNLANLLAPTAPHEAIPLYRHAYALGHQGAGANLALTLARLDSLEESLALYEALLAASPHDPALHFNHANTLALASSEARAIEAYERAITLDPTAPAPRLNLAYLHLCQGRYKLGWELYEARREMEAMTPHLAGASGDDSRSSNPQESLPLEASQKESASDISSPHEGDLPLRAPVQESTPPSALCAQDKPDTLAPLAKLWHSGVEITGKRLFVYHEQGLGDTLMFARFLPWLQARAAAVLFLPQAPLRPLFKEALATPPRPDDYDLALPLPSLPLALGLENLDPLACRGALPWDSSASPHKNRASDSVPKVALTFASHSAFPASAAKSLPARELLESLQGLPLALYSFQIEGIEESLAREFGVKDIGRTLGDFGATKSALESMDFVITVDTAMAHLAGSLGMEGAVLLPKRADWRWGEGESSPWYPSLRLFRQTHLDDWSAPLSELRDYLKERSHAK